LGTDPTTFIAEARGRPRPTFLFLSGAETHVLVRRAPTGLVLGVKSYEPEKGALDVRGASCLLAPLGGVVLGRFGLGACLCRPEGGLGLGRWCPARFGQPQQLRRRSRAQPGLAGSHNRVASRLSRLAPAPSGWSSAGRRPPGERGGRGGHQVLYAWGQDGYPAGCHEHQVSFGRALFCLPLDARRWSCPVTHDVLRAFALYGCDPLAQLEAGPPGERALQELGQVQVETGQDMVGELENEGRGAPARPSVTSISRSDLDPRVTPE